jgi:molecular chaperone GrpE
MSDKQKENGQQSKEEEIKKADLDEEAFTDKKKEEEKPKEPSKDDEIKQLKGEVEKWKNQFYTAYADLDNLRKSLEKDHQEALKYRSEGFLQNLIPSLDSFYIALSGEVQGEEAKNYRVGFQYIYNQIESALESEGVKEILPKVGERFDATCMHAVDTVDSETEDGTVATIHMKGYRLKDRLVRPAMVSVYKKAEAKKESDGDKPLDIKEDKENEAHKA